MNLFPSILAEILGPAGAGKAPAQGRRAIRFKSGIKAVFSCTVAFVVSCVPMDGEIAKGGAAAQALAERPDFDLPFACDEVWALTTYKNHNPEDKKIDFIRSDPEGRAVLAPADGIVHELIPSEGGVEINHGGGWFTLFLHMKNITVRGGDRLVRGQQFGQVSKVNSKNPKMIPHLHAEQLYDFDGNGDVENPDIQYPVWQGRLYSLTEADQPFPSVASTNCGGPQPSRKKTRSDINKDEYDDVVGIGPRSDGGMEITAWLSTHTTVGGGNSGGSDGSYATARLTLGDMDGDGAADLIAAFPRAGGGTDFKVSLGVPKGTGFAGFKPAGETDGMPARIHAADVNGDGKDDLIGLAPTGSGTTTIMTWRSSGVAFGWGLAFESQAVYSQLRTAVGHFDKDKAADLIAALPGRNGGTDFKVSFGIVDSNQNALGGFKNAGSTVGMPHRIYAGDVNGDRLDDIVGLSPTALGKTYISAWMSNGASIEGGNSKTSEGAYATLRPTLADINRDGQVDLIIALPDPGGVTEFKIAFGRKNQKWFDGFVHANSTLGNPSYLLSR